MGTAGTGGRGRGGCPDGVRRSGFMAPAAGVKPGGVTRSCGGTETSLRLLLSGRDAPDAGSCGTGMMPLVPAFWPRRRSARSTSALWNRDSNSTMLPRRRYTLPPREISSSRLTRRSIIQLRSVARSGHLRISTDPLLRNNQGFCPLLSPRRGPDAGLPLTGRPLAAVAAVFAAVDAETGVAPRLGSLFSMGLHLVSRQP